MTQKETKISHSRLRAAITGDRNAFRTLFMEYQPRIYRFLWLKLRSVEVAEDLVQETFVRLWQKPKQIRSIDALETYLFRIAENVAIDFFRKQKKEKNTHPTADSLSTRETMPDGLIEDSELSKHIDSVIQNLPPNRKTAFILSRYEELSYKQIAEIMSISIKTVEKHIIMALQTLKEELKKFDLWIK